MTKEDSIFPNIDLPGGISTKATEYRELARKGDKWESPVFSIGSAKKSTDIPSAPKIQRKAHPVSDLGPKNTSSADYDFYPAVGNTHTGNGALNGGNGLQIGNGAVNGKHPAGFTNGQTGLPTGQAPLTTGQINPV